MNRNKKHTNEKQIKEIFEATVIPLYGDVYKYLLHLGCDCHLAENISQITMEKAWINREKLISVDYKKQWMFRVAYNEYITFLRFRSHSFAVFWRKKPSGNCRNFESELQHNTFYDCTGIK